MKALLVLLAVSGSALADDADLLRCRAIADVAARVACYDGIPLAVKAAAPDAKAAPQPASFGLTARQMRKADEPDFIESSLLGRIDGWGPTTQFRLANGQVWRVADDSSGSVIEIENPKVRVTRNALGTLFLEIEGSKQAPRVRRLQ